jgi:tetratricopeptide (TPR) repeat protein
VISEDRDEYRRTLFDRQGPEAAHFLQVVSSLIIPIVAGAFIGGALAVRKDFSAALTVLSALAGSITLAVWWWYFVTRVSRGVAEGALASYEKMILEAPNDPQPRIRAADLYAKAGMRERAEILYRAVQRLSRVALRDDVYASNRLVDLYLAWPGRETQGLRELRRLVDTYPETDVAKRARAGLVNLKSQLGVAE